MRAVRCAAGGVRVVDVGRPCGEGVRVRVVSAGICGSDLHMVAGRFPVSGTLGHEFAGIAPDGSAVAVEPLDPCGRCEPCRAGDYNLCSEGGARIFGIGRDGGMAEEVRVPERALVPLARGVSPRDACLVEPLAVAIHGLRRVGLRGGQRVEIVGAGAIGLCAVAAAVAAGARVGLAARHDAQREAAERLGAGASSGGAELVVDAAGTKSALAVAAELARPGATLLLLGSYWEGFEIDGFALLTKELDVVPSYLYGRRSGERDFERAAALLAARPEIAETLITHRFPLDAAAEAFAVAEDRAAGAIKVVLEP